MLPRTAHSCLHLIALLWVHARRERNNLQKKKTKRRKSTCIWCTTSDCFKPSDNIAGVRSLSVKYRNSYGMLKAAERKERVIVYKKKNKTEERNVPVSACGAQSQTVTSLVVMLRTSVACQ